MLNQNSATRRMPESLVLAISTIVLGVLVGCSSVVLSLLLSLVEHVFLNFKETMLNPAPVATLPWHRFGSVVIGGIIAAIVWYLLRSKTQGPVSINAALKGKNMPVLPMVIHVITQIFYVGVGGSVGRELAPVKPGH